MPIQIQNIINEASDTSQYLGQDIITACSTGDENTIVNYIDNGGDVNLKSVYGYTPLIYATFKNHFNIVSILINAKVDVNMKDNDGNTALYYANKKGYSNIITILVNAGAN